jgi:hypothetical protein
MGSVSSTNPAVANLLQILTSVNSPVMSSPAAVGALQKAPATDIAQLSVSAMELQSMDEMFGISNGPNPENSVLANLGYLANESAATAASSTASPTTTLANQLANYQGASQLSETQALFDTGETGSSDSSLNVIG